MQFKLQPIKTWGTQKRADIFTYIYSLKQLFEEMLIKTKPTPFILSNIKYV